MLIPFAAPSVNFNLSNWKLTLPVDSAGGLGGTATEIKSLVGYQNAAYFSTGADGAMVFTASVNGASTSGSNYARSELREMAGSERAAWSLAQGGHMAATVEVDQVPNLHGGPKGKVIIGQIHGQDDELVRLVWEKGSVYFVNDQAGAGNTEMKFQLLDGSGRAADIALHERFSYAIDAHGSTLDVKVFADGKLYQSVTPINSVWQNDSFYFKAGAYLGVNETQGVGVGQVSFYDLAVDHANQASAAFRTLTGTSLADDLGGTDAGDLIQAGEGADQVSGLQGDDTVNGNQGDDVINGNQGNDTVQGGQGDDLVQGGKGDDFVMGNLGNDRLCGNLGNDVLTGGAGSDVFVFALGSGQDIVTDFSFVEGDRLNFGGRGYTLDTAMDGSTEIVFNDGGGTIVLSGVTSDEFNANFIV